MNYFITVDGVVITGFYSDKYTDIPASAVPISFIEGELLRKCSNFSLWQYVGTAVVQAPAPALTAADFTSAVQSHLDATARTRNYDGILSACSYATSTNLPFSVEGQACVAWRDAVWLYCYQQLALVQAGTRTIPATTAAFIAELPVISW